MDKQKDFFIDREDALSRLVKELEGVDFHNSMVLSISTDAVSLARGVANHFNLPLEHLFIQPIYAKENPDCTIGVVSELRDVVFDDELLRAFDISVDYIYEQAKKCCEDTIAPLAKTMRSGESIASFAGKNILIVDEGVETGFSIEVAIKTCINQGCKSASIATPVLSSDVENYLLKYCDCIYSVIRPEFFVSTNYYYKELQTQRKDFLRRENFLM